jgi:signal transduction histidine kinase/CheY-like chemotaxis protein/HAMP domain-containing protein
MVCLCFGAFLLVIGLVFFTKISSDFRESQFERLQAVRDLRANEISGWITRISDDLLILSASTEVRRTGTLLGTGINPGAAGIETLNRTFGNYLQNHNGYLEFFIIGASSGSVVYSTNRDAVGEDRANHAYVTGALRKKDVFITDIYYSKNLNIPTMTFSAPVYPQLKENTAPRCVLVARIYLERSLYSSLLDRTGLGQTGEVILVNRDQIAVNKLKSDNTPPLTLKIRDEAAIRALNGQTGVVETEDYRGRNVIAAYTSIPSMNWGMIVKQDADEAYRPLAVSGIILLLLFVLVMAVLAGLSLRFSDSITAPLVSLTEVARRILKGDYNERSGIERDDELGDLAGALNGMADSIVSQLRIEKVSSDIIEVIVSTIDLGEFSRKVIGKIMEVTESNIAAFYVLSGDGREFRHYSSIGLENQFSESFHAGRLEGEFGKALATREITITRNLDESTMVLLKTVVGSVVPREIITVPIIVNNMSTAVISLASLKGYTEEAVKILDHIRPVMNTAYSNILAIEETRRLASELTDKNFQLESKRETLENQAAELKKQADHVRRQNIEMEIQKAKVEEANKLKSEFLSNMSHELRTPLNSVLALSRVLLMQSRDKLTAEETDYIRIIGRNGEKLLMLINDILDLSKIEAGKIDLRPRSISLRTIIGVIVENLEQLAEEKGIELAVSCQADLPEIVSDESRVYQIFQNIIGNAVKFTEKGSVRISANGGDGRVRVTVEDTGIGIDDRDLPHIFEEFRQLDGTLSRKYEGTGLGLAIAIKSAELISGTISVDSEKGKGSRFEVILPVEWTGQRISPHRGSGTDSAEKDGDLETLPVRDRGRAGEEFEAREQARERLPAIVVIEDDPDNMTTIRAILKGAFRIFEASEGRTGIELVYRNLPDVVLLDIALPGISGFTVIKEIKANYLTRNIPVIALTALSMKGDRDRILGAGCDDYLAKPYNIEELMEKINKWLNRTDEHHPRD